MSRQSRETNYNFADGDIINQSGSFGTGVDKRKKSMPDINQYGLGDNIAGDKVMGNKINSQTINNSQDLIQAAQDIKVLLDQISADYPSDSPRVLGAKALDEIDKSPELKSRILRGLKVGSFSALEKMIDHPIAKFFIEGVKEILNP